jgi:2,3-dimethylmalate lyase
MIGKIHAAVDTRGDPYLIIIARSDARAAEGLQAAIDRVNAHLEAGADVGFVEAPQSVEELRIVGRAVRGPVLVNVFESAKTQMPPAAAFAAMGFRVGIYPSQTQRAATRAAQKVLRALQDLERHRLGIGRTQAPVRDRRAIRVARQIGEHRLADGRG